MEWVYAIPTNHRPFVNESCDPNTSTESPPDTELAVLPPPIPSTFPRVLTARQRFLSCRKPWQDAYRPSSDPPGRWWRLFLYSLTTTLALSPWFQIPSILPQLLEVYKISLTEGLVLVVMTPVGFAIGGLFSGYFRISDRLSPQYLIPSACVVATGANLLSLIEVYGFVIFLRLIIGAMMALIFPPTIKLCSTWFYYQRGLAVGTLMGCLSLGTAIPSLIIGTTVVNWRILVGITSACCGLAGVLIFFLGQPGPLHFLLYNTARRL